MRKPSKKNNNRRDIFAFVGGAIVGLSFALGLTIIEKQQSRGFIADIIHLLAPAGLVGFIALFLSEWAAKRIKSSILKYVMACLFGTIIGAASSFIVLGEVAAKVLYIVIWTGAFLGLVFRLALDEIVLESKIESKKGERKLKIANQSSVEKEPVEVEGASGAQIQWLISKKDGAPNFALRRFTLAPSGCSPKHKHPYEHEVYVLSGTGVLDFEGVEYPLSVGTFALVTPNREHQFRNTSADELVFLCAIPNI